MNLTNPKLMVSYNIIMFYMYIVINPPFPIIYRRETLHVLSQLQVCGDFSIVKPSR